MVGPYAVVAKWQAVSADSLTRGQCIRRNTRAPGDAPKKCIVGLATDITDEASRRNQRPA